ncbi:MAG TPA: hypothetical protein VHS96_01305, partial [Bacteroidia bacterium]|nr:hypothetical protein [Bacteroidia bacterium]
GDFNLDGSTPQSFQNMVAHSNPDCKMNDLLGLTGNWHGNANCRPSMTQATDPNPNNPCGSGGALDDRFDHIIVSNDIFNNTADLRYIPGTYWVMGNPYAPNAPVGTTVESYIKLMSDHHPVIIDLEVSRAVANAEPRAVEDLMRLRMNPAEGSLRLRLALEAYQGHECAIDLVSLNGQVVKAWPIQAQATAQDLELDAAGIPAGAYFLRLQADGAMRDVEKVLVGLH